MRFARAILLPLTFLLAASTPGARAQQAPAAPATPAAAPAWLASLTPEQRTLFDSVRKDFDAADFADALPKLLRIHEQAPQNDIVSKFTAEAAINTGDFKLASSLLDPMLRANPDDPQALGLEAHLYGQQHDVAGRDAAMDRIQKLHDAGKFAPATVIIENDPLPGGGRVRICDYVVPQSRFHIVLMAEFFDAAGTRVRRTALESDDIDQVQFRKDHPDDAAAGVRMYSMDTYTETRNAQGQMTSQTHGTLCPVPGCFMTGRPSYELFRSTVLGATKAGPISSTTTPAKSQ